MPDVGAVGQVEAIAYVLVDVKADGVEQIEQGDDGGRDDVDRDTPPYTPYCREDGKCLVYLVLILVEVVRGASDKGERAAAEEGKGLDTLSRVKDSRTHKERGEEERHGEHPPVSGELVEGVRHH